MQVLNVVSVQAAFSVRLHHDAAHLAVMHEIPHVAGPEHDRQRIADLRNGNSHGKGFFPVNGDVQTRRIRLAGEINARQVGVRVGTGQELVPGFRHAGISQAALVLEAEVESGRIAQLRQSRHVQSHDHHLAISGKAGIDTVNNRLDSTVFSGTLVPVFQTDKQHGHVGSGAHEAEPSHGVNVLHRLMPHQVILHFPQPHAGFLLKGAGREGHHRHEVALVFFRKEGGGQRKVQIAGPCNNEGIQEQGAHRAADHSGYGTAVPVRGPVYRPVEPSEKTLFLLVLHGGGFQHGGAQRRSQGKGQKRGEGYGHNERYGKLPVNVPHSSAEKGHGHENRHEHGGDAHDGPADLLHGFHRSAPGIQAFLHHDAFHIFHHHDGVIHQNADAEHHAEHGKHVDGEPGEPHHGKGPQQGYGDDERGNQGSPEVLEEQEHDQEHQQDGFQQG